MKKLVFTTEQMTTALDRLAGGSDLSTEAERLGVSADLFHSVLLQVIYVAAYLRIAAYVSRPEAERKTAYKSPNPPPKRPSKPSLERPSLPP